QDCVQALGDANGNDWPYAVPRIRRGQLRHRDRSLCGWRMGGCRRPVHAARNLSQEPCILHFSQTRLPMTKSSFRIAVIAGDGIGREVIPAGIAAIEAVARGSDVEMDFTEFPWGCEFYLKHKRM